jgi:hypothetical protein
VLHDGRALGFAREIGERERADRERDDLLQWMRAFNAGEYRLRLPEGSADTVSCRADTWRSVMTQTRAQGLAHVRTGYGET